jgi:hypothetical protein
MAQAARTLVGTTSASLKQRLIDNAVEIGFAALTVLLYGLLRIWSLGRWGHTVPRGKAPSHVPRKLRTTRRKAAAAHVSG